MSDMMSPRTICQYQWARMPLCMQQGDVISGHQKEQSLTSRSAVCVLVLQALLTILQAGICSLHYSLPTNRCLPAKSDLFAVNYIRSESVALDLL